MSAYMGCNVLVSRHFLMPWHFLMSWHLLMGNGLIDIAQVFTGNSALVLVDYFIAT